MNSRPFSLLKTAFDPLFPLDSIVMFEQDGQPVVALVTGNKHERYLAHCSAGKEHELTKNRLHRVPGTLTPSAKTHSEKIEALKELVRGAAVLTIETGELWNLFQEYIEKTLSEDVITERKFGSITPESYIAVRSALLRDRIYFKRDQNGFSPRPAHIIEQMKESEARRAEKRSGFIETVKFLKAKSKDKALPCPDSLTPFISILEDCAASAHPDNSSFYDDAEELVLLGEKELHIEPHGKLEQRAFHLLYKAGHFKKDTNISIIRHKPHTLFPDEALQEARALVIPQTHSEFSDANVRKDFTALDSFTIDDDSTQDMDDALSFETLDSGFRLYVHVSDVAYAIPQGSALDGEALRRATSIYCPDITINMLPEELSQHTLSLVVGAVRPCISCIFEINSAYEVTHADIVPSIVRVSKKYSYNDVDEFLYKGIEPFTRINNIAATLEQKRIAQGATRITKRDAQPVLKGSEISVIEVDEQSPARNLIGEMMVLANTVMANFLYTHELPALYRSQEVPDPAALREIEEVPQGPARDYAERVRLKRSVVSLTPGYHATLGLNAYIQCTSPIRRYIDLVLQRQILNYIRNGSITYTGEALIDLQTKIEEPLYKAMAISKETKRYWILRYLERTYKDIKKIKGTVVRVDTKMPMVELDEVFIIAGARMQNAKLGQEVLLSVHTVDPRSDYLRLDEVKRPQKRN